MSSCSSATTTTFPAGVGSTTPITAIHPDIIHTHILTRLDGPTLASTSCSSSQLHTLSTEENLWRDMCISKWPSTNDPLITDTISSFPSGHRSFFSDAFPSLHHQKRNFKSQPNHQRSSSILELISAIDIHYKKNLVLSKVHVTETVTGWFLCSPLRVDLLDPKETVPTPVKFEGDEETFRADLEEFMTLSWIITSPNTKRAVNLSSLRPVSVQRHWLTGDFEVRYSTILTSGFLGKLSELVQCSVVVKCGGKGGGELKVKEVSMQVEDMDGKILSGKESLVILEEAMESERRKRGKRGEERERYEEYVEMKRERRERKESRERRLDMVCMVTGITVFLAFWAFVLLR